MFRGLYTGLLLVSYICIVVSEVKQECVTSPWGHGDNDPGEFREPDEMGRSMHGYMATGTLTCSYGNGGSILVKRVTYGLSMYPGRCHGGGFCGEESDAGTEIATRCDGQGSCTVDLRNPAYLKCGQMSNYMLVEYECIDTWATYDLCKNVSTEARDPFVYITSPGYLDSRAPRPSRGTKMCECIIRSRDRADIYLDYLETKLSSDGQTCPYEYVLLQNKKNMTQSTIDNEVEVCGSRRIAGRWYTGTVRIIMASGGSMQKRGLLAKITVDNIGRAPRLDIECGTIPNSGVNLQERPVLRESIGSTITRSRINSGPMGGPMGMPMPGSMGGPMGMPMPGSMGGPMGGAHYPPIAPQTNVGSAYGRSFGMAGMDDSPYDDAHERYNPYDDAQERYYPPHMAHQPPWQRPVAPPPSPPGPVRTRSFVPDPAPPPGPPGPVPTRSFAPDPTPPHRQPMPTPMHSGPPSRRMGFQPDITRLKINLPGDKKSGPPLAKPPTRFPMDGPRTNKPNTAKKPKNREPTKKGRNEVRNGKPKQIGPNKKGTGRRVDEQDPALEESIPLKDSEGRGGLVALVFGGVGSVLILGSVSIIALHNYRKRQRIKREEAEYAYSSSAGSAYGRGWPKEREEDESVYATVKEVDLYRESCVNPSGGVIAEPQKPTVVVQERDRIETCFKHTENNVKRDRFAYDGPMGKSVNAVTVDDIAVIEVHQPFDGKPETKEHQHDTDCLRNFGYSTVDKEEHNPYCTSCEIRRPPRRKDKTNDYDNNLGIRGHRS